MKTSNRTRHHRSRAAFSCLVILALTTWVGCGKSGSGDRSTSPAEDGVTENEPAVNTSATVTLPVGPEPDLKYPVPQGSASALANFLGEMAQRDPQGSSPDESTADLAEISRSRQYAADRILAIPDADPVFRMMASEAKLESLRTLALIGQGDQSDFGAFAEELVTSNDDAISLVGRIGQLQNTLDEVRMLGVVDTEELLASVNGIAKKVDRQNHPDLRVLYALSETGRVMQQVDEVETAIAVFEIGADLLSGPKGDTRSGLAISTRFAHELEGVGQIDSARKLLKVVQAKFGEHSDRSLKNDALAAIEVAEKRFRQIGQLLEIQGEAVDGTAFDSESLQGKVVLLQFWTTSSPLTDPRFAELQKLFLRHHESGLEIVSVGVDDDQALVGAYFGDAEAPWTTLRNSDSILQRYGIDIDMTPYSFLADASGKIVKLNPTGDELRDLVANLLNEITSENSADSSDVDASANSRDDKATSTTEQESDKPDSASAGSKKPIDAIAATQGNATVVAYATPDEGETADDKSLPAERSSVVEDAAERNPYLPSDDLSTTELVEFILEMQDKTRSIQHRDGFAAGVIAACDRVLKSDAKDRFQVVAALAKLNYLHREASTGDQQATDSLNEMIASFQADSRPKIAAEIVFLTAEKNVLDAEEKPAAEIATDIESALAFFSQATDLAPKHLRMASATVGLINKTDDVQQREDYFQQLGEHLSRSSDKSVSRYGKRIAGPSGDGGPAGNGGPSNLVGQVLEIAGETVDGDTFHWDHYRGQVVLIDFWATWCGPCRVMMPKIEALYDQNHKRGFDVVGISLDQDLDQLSEFLADHAVPWTLLAGETTSDLADKFNVRGIPLLMLVDTQGKVVATGHNLESVTSKLDSLLDERNKND